MKITVKNLKPRNPLVVLARSRNAGCHRTTTRAMRQKGGRWLQREIDQMKQQSP
jgi:hypothetical protein